MARRRMEVKKAGKVIDFAAAGANGAREEAVAKAQLRRNVMARLRKDGHLHDEIVELLNPPLAPPPFATLVTMIERRFVTLGLGLCTDLACLLRVAKRSAAN